MKREAKLRQAARQTASSFVGTFPILLGVLGLVSLITVLVPPNDIAGLIPMQGVFGPLFGAIAGSIAAGHPVTSYVIAGELTSAGAGLATVTAFIVSWVTVGVVHLPAEAAILGTRFALWRNAISFVLAIVMAYVVTALIIVVS